MPPSAIPSTPGAATPELTDAELQELDELLAATPEPLMPMDVVMLDGYLCGVLVQPALIAAEQWLPHVVDLESRPLPEGTDDVWRGRLRALTLRRHSELNRTLLEDGWFDPLILEHEDTEPSGNAADPLAGMHPVSRPLMPWVTGFQYACVSFPALLELPDDAVMAALARVFRHLPAQTDEEREIAATLEREMPLTTLDDAIEELVACVADLADLTHDARYHVDTVRRDAPKAGRNDPCPCGSGRKYKRCHGAA